MGKKGLNTRRERQVAKTASTSSPSSKKDSNKKKLRSKFKLRAINAWQKRMLTVIGTGMIALSWCVQNFFIERNKDIIADITMNMSDFRRVESEARQNDWRYIFTLLHNQRLDTTKLIDRMMLSDAQYRERLVMADVQELEDYHAMRLFASRIMYTGDSLDEEEKLYILTSEHLKKLKESNSADSLEDLLKYSNDDFDNFQYWIKYGSYQKIQSLTNRNKWLRICFYIFFIGGTLLITVDRATSHIKEQEVL